MQRYSSKPHLQALEDGTALPSIVTPPPGPQSRQLTERLSKVEPPTSSVIKRGQTPVFWERTRGANIVDVAPDSRRIEVTGDEDKIESLQNLLGSFGVMEVMRTGMIAMGRGMPAAQTEGPANGARPRLESGL